MVNVHLRGAFLVTQAAYKVMARQPGGGRIVVITSSAGLLGSPGQSTYAAAKMGQIGLLRSVAHEGVEAGIRVNAVAPGAFTPAMIDELKASAISGPMASFDADLLDRMTPDRVAPLVVALAHRSCPCTGQVFCGWGGYYGRGMGNDEPGVVAIGMALERRRTRRPLGGRQRPTNRLRTRGERRHHRTGDDPTRQVAIGR